jgi:hypothetical protein
MMPLWPVACALAAATPGSLVVVDVDFTDGLVGLAGQVTRSVVDEAGRQKYQVTPPEALLKRMDLKRVQELKKCAGKAPCVASLLSGQGFDRAVVGVLSRDAKNYLLKLWLIDVAKAEVIADIDRPVLIAARRFTKDLEQAVPALLRGEREARGTLTIRASAPNTQVIVNGEAKGLAPFSAELRPGKYEVRLERPKYLPVTRLLAVEANQTTDETLNLLLAPGEIADTDTIPPLPPGAGSQTASIRAGTVISAAAMAVAIGIGVGFGVSASNADAVLRRGFEATTQVYQGTRAQALGAQRDATIANVAFGVAGGLGLLTVILLVADLTRPVTVAVSTPQGGFGVSLGGVW